MTPLEIAVTAAGLALIGFLACYFFSPWLPATTRGLTLTLQPAFGGP